MGKRYVIHLTILVLICLQLLVPAHAWSVEGHTLVTTRAVQLLPQPWRTFFQQYNWLLNESVAYPDTLYRGADPAEGPRHFVDLEVWNPNDPSTGTLPQSVNEFTMKMESAIMNRDWNAMFLDAGRVAHYIADDTQPYHSTKYYNPATRNGVRLHQILDASMIDHLSELRMINENQFGQLTPIGNLTQFALDTAAQSHSFLPIINRTLIDENRSWSQELTKIIENRTNTAIVAVARVWYTAIVNARMSPPDIPNSNSLSIVVENYQTNREGASTIRIGIVDALGIKTPATVSLVVNGALYRGHVAKAIPPIGEYEIILEAGTHTGTFTFRADRTGYTSAVVGVTMIGSSTTQGMQATSPLTSSSLVSVSQLTIQIGAVVTLIAIILVLLRYRRSFTNS